MSGRSGRRARSSRRLVAAATLAALVPTGGATAYFAAAGSGSGTVRLGAAEPVAIAAGTAPSAPLFPGGDGDVTAQVSNPSAGPAHLGALTLDSARGEGGFDASRPGCDAAALSFTPQSNGGAGWDVPANGTLDLDLAGAVHLAATAADACQGATFTVYLRVP
jgi:hypothetical protein